MHIQASGKYPVVMPKRDQHPEELRENGFTVIENAIEPKLIDSLDDALMDLETELEVKPGANRLEGSDTFMNVWDALDKH